MHLSAPNSQYITWVSILILLFINLFSVSLSDSDPRITQVGFYCDPIRTPGPYLVPTTTRLFQIIKQLVANQTWGSYQVDADNSTAQVYGLAQCYQDLSNTDCQLCFAAGRNTLPVCLSAISGRIYLDGCFIRYANYSFFNESTDPINDKVNCSSSYGVAIGNHALELNQSVGLMIENVTKTALSNDGFAIGEVKGVFGLAQCWKTLSNDSCRECLEKASREVIGKCLPNKEGRALNVGCYLRYSTVKFYNDGKGHGDSGLSVAATRAIALLVAAFTMLSLFVAYAIYMRWLKSKQRRNNLGPVLISYNNSGLSYKYETLEKATNYFDPLRKIGEGGAGSVFKGILPDGKTVAVKRLFFNSRQWVDEFFNEVNLISGIQHKNLVKLLGCSIEGPESVLVYEYVPNKSLDQFLFDKTKIQILNWKQRFDIIVGTAEGLAHLHGGTHIRIIHRDIKSSNVLLDENLAPKIADFGLARCFAADKTHLSTGIAGTLGYMAPEYLVRGQLTEKADVYCFGVLVHEIVCGRKNNVFIEHSSSLLQTVWKFHKTNNMAECVDPCLKNDFPVNEASKVLQIGLLCTQASIGVRPSMDKVVQMLTNKDCEIPLPNQPPFLNSSMLESGSSANSYSLNSLVTNVMAKLQASDTSTGSSSMQSSD